MPTRKLSQDRLTLLADVAEMYYLQNKNQQEIAEIIGVTRSMVSRMLTEAYKKGVFTITINRPIQLDTELANQLQQRFDLSSATVLQISRGIGRDRFPQSLGLVGAQILTKYLNPDTILGLTWGSGVSAVVDSFEIEGNIPLKVVQLTGALGVQNNEYNGQILAQKLADKLGAEAFFLNAPFVCSTPQVAQSLIESPGVHETIALGKQADVVLAGVGSIDPEQSSLYRSGYLSLPEIQHLADLGTIGDVCGRNFNVDGQSVSGGYGQRLVTIKTEDLLKIPIRIGVAGGPKKAKPILGALRGGYVNVLVTDSITAGEVLEQVEV